VKIFFDSSAFAKRFIEEAGSDKVESQCSKASALGLSIICVSKIISAPGMKSRGTRTDSLVEMVDFYPTLAELAGLPTPVKIAGVSMVPVLNDPAAKTRDSALTQLKSGNGHSIRTERYRFTRWEKGGKNMIELYDWQSDPDEMVNLARNPEYNKTVEKMEALWHKRVKAASIPPAGVKIKPLPPSKRKKISKKK